MSNKQPVLKSGNAVLINLGDGVQLCIDRGKTGWVKGTILCRTGNTDITHAWDHFSLDPNEVKQRALTHEDLEKTN